MMGGNSDGLCGLNHLTRHFIPVVKIRAEREKYFLCTKDADDEPRVIIGCNSILERERERYFESAVLGALSISRSRTKRRNEKIGEDATDDSQPVKNAQFPFGDRARRTALAISVLSSSTLL